MPNPLRCQLDASQATPTFDCTPVEIESRPSAGTNQCLDAPDRSLPDGEEVLSAPPAHSVSSLVQAVTPGRVTLPPVAVPVLPFLAEAIRHCPSETLDVGLVAAAAAARNVPVAIMAGAKLGIDLGQCLAPQYDRKQEQLATSAAETYCRSDGGEPRQWSGSVLQCVYSPVAGQ